MQSLPHTSVLLNLQLLLLPLCHASPGPSAGALRQLLAAAGPQEVGSTVLTHPAQASPWLHARST